MDQSLSKHLVGLQPCIIVSNAIEGQAGIDCYSSYYMLLCRICSCAIFKNKFMFSGIRTRSHVITFSEFKTI